MKKSQNGDIPVAVAKATTHASFRGAQLIWDIKNADTIIQLKKSVKSPQMTIEDKELEQGMTQFWQISLRAGDKLNLSLDLRTCKGNSYSEFEFDFTLGGQTAALSCVKSGVFTGKYDSWATKWEVTSVEKSFTMDEPVSNILKERKLFSGFEGTLRVAVNLRTVVSLVGSIDVPFPTLSESTSMETNWIAELYNQSLHSDVTIQCQTEVFRCHKLILRQSSVFEKMITSPMLESLTNVVTISDVNPAVLDLFLKSLYGKQFDVPTDCKTLLELINCAEKYDMKALKFTCLEAMAPLLSYENAGQLTLAAYRYCDDERFQSYFKTYCQQRHAILIKKPAYLELYKSNLEAFV